MGDVISIFSKKKEEKQEKEVLKDMDLTIEAIFLAVMKKNEENKKRIEEDKKKKNKSVLRAYRIKE